MDDRGQSLGIAGLFLSLIVGAVGIWIVQLLGTPMLDQAANAMADAQANAATGWFRTVIDWLPIIFLLIGMFGLIVYAIYLRGLQQ